MKTCYIKTIFLVFATCILASCWPRDISAPCVEQVSIQWCFYDEDVLKSGCTRKGEVSYSPSKEEQEMLLSWISDFARTAHDDFVSYVPVLVIRGENFFINISGNKIILNIETEAGGSWTQISRNRKDIDEEIVNLAMKIMMKSDS